MRIFEALFKGVSTQFGQRTIEKCFENPHFIFCYSFQNLRLGSIKSGTKASNPKATHRCHVGARVSTHLKSVYPPKRRFCYLLGRFPTQIIAFVVIDSDSRYGEPRIAQFRTHDLTKKLAYVSTQQLKRFKRSASSWPD
jgi:hypothetical protein